MDGQGDILTGGTIASTDSEGLLAGIQLISEIFEEAVRSIQAQVPAGTFASTEVYFQPLGRDFIVALKYDPDGFFQKNMPGGFKLSASKVSRNNGVGGVDGTESYDAGIVRQGDGRVLGLHGFDVPLQR